MGTVLKQMAIMSRASLPRRQIQIVDIMQQKTEAAHEHALIVSLSTLQDCC
jgi:hypothetical protein